MTAQEKQAFGARLKQLREAAGLSQQGLAVAAGMNLFGVAKLERGINGPTWGSVLALAGALKVSCEAFVIEDRADPSARAASSPARPRSAGKPAPGPSGQKKAAAGQRRKRKRQ